MVSTSATTSAGMSQTKLFLKSVGKYGPTPFLWPLYGGEINQAFCRLDTYCQNISKTMISAVNSVLLPIWRVA